ncbi:O-antigen ligase family protein [Pseudoalteromonas lipolytica]|uniref:O-antigen ligase family protein n=1 Tax=Pseudoalteromonas lipolytica TaxID=570156 RepID=UPI003BA3CCEB
MLNLDKNNKVLVFFTLFVYSFALPNLRFAVGNFTIPPTVLFILLLGFFLVKLKNIKLDVYKFNALFLLFISVVALSGVINQQDETLLFLFKLLFCQLIFLLTYKLLELNFDKLKLFLLVGLFSSFSLLIHMYASYYILGSPYLSGSLSIVTEQGKNQIAAYLAIMSVIFFCTIYCAPQQNKKNFFVFFLIHFIGLIYSFSRSALICTLIAIFCFLMLRNQGFLKKLKQVFIVSLIVVSGSIILLPFLPEVIVDSLESNIISIIEFQDSGDSTSISKRTEMIYLALELFEENIIIGSGAMSFYHKAGIASHNTFLQILSEFGILGLLSFLAFYCYALFISLKRNIYFFPALLCFFFTMFFQNVLDLMFLYVIFAFAFLNGEEYVRS